jgi:hypothetical protein
LPTRWCWPAPSDGQRIARYPTYFEIAWKLGIQLLFSLLFVLGPWLCCGRRAATSLIKLGFLKKLLGQAWFVILVICFAFRLPSISRMVRPSIVRGIRTLLRWCCCRG